LEIEVTAKRLRMPDSIARFSWTVGAPAVDHPILISQQPLEPYVTRGALIVAIVVALLTGFKTWRAARRPAVVRQRPIVHRKPQIAEGAQRR
jgi:hypothetical protein